MRNEATLFLRSSALFGLLCAVLLGAAVLFGPPLSRNTYLDGIKAKHARLDSIPAPRILIVGGSNAAFGIDSPELERAFHLPVVNMALHASLGYGFMVDEVMDAIGKGDVVLVFPEHSLYVRPDRQEDVLYTVMDNYGEALDHVPVMDRPHVVANYALRKLQGTWSALVKRPKPVQDSIYNAGAFNAEGDVVSHLHLPSPGVADSTSGRLRRIVAAPEFDAIHRALAARARERGATVIVCWPSHMRSRSAARVCDDLLKAVEAQGLPFAGMPCDYELPDSLFFDTPYHLTAAGRGLRTARLIEDLRKADPALGLR